MICSFWSWRECRDTVGVAVVDVKSGQSLGVGRTLDENKNDFGLRRIWIFRWGTRSQLAGDFKTGEDVVKYGVVISRVVKEPSSRAIMCMCIM